MQKPVDMNVANAIAAGFQPDALTQVVAFAEACGAGLPLDTGKMMFDANTASGEGALAAMMGPMKERGPSTGVVLRNGMLAASWGTPERADVAFSLAKSCLNALTGLALGKGLIRNLDEPVSTTVKASWFEGPHNGAVTWRQMLQLTSEWNGTLFDRPDSIDWHRAVGGSVSKVPKGSPRELAVPGAHWEYNDVRINALSLALMLLYGEPLPQVLQREIMAPLGMSPDWRWLGFDKSTVRWRGGDLPFVPGGSHWGGGLHISALDLARLGQLYLQDGHWQDRKILPEGWIAETLRPGLNPAYGLLWWLNTAPALPQFSGNTFWAAGLGGNILLIEPAADLVVVIRWVEMKERDLILSGIRSAIA